MIKLTDPLPRYLLESRQIRNSILYTIAFSLLVLLLYSPYSDRAWLALGAGPATLFSLAFVVVGAALIAASRLLLRSFRSVERFSLLSYLLWNLVEIVILALVYTGFTCEGSRLGFIAPAACDIARVLPPALLCSAVCLGLPFWFCSLQASLQDKDNTIRLTNYDDVVSDRPAVPYRDDRITLFDNNGALKFSASSDSLYFIESDDNYIKVWYMDSAGEMKQYMLRCRLKTVEDSFADSELVRCHRKYIVNIRKVATLKSEKDGYRIDFDIDSVDPIPISKTYEQAVLARFNSR